MILFFHFPWFPQYTQAASAPQPAPMNRASPNGKEILPLNVGVFPERIRRFFMI